jgi:hypothetical protein
MLRRLRNWRTEADGRVENLHLPAHRRQRGRRRHATLHLACRGACSTPRRLEPSGFGLPQMSPTSSELAAICMRAQKLIRPGWSGPCAVRYWEPSCSRARPLI